MRPGRRTPALGLLAPLCALAALPLLGGQQLSPQVKRLDSLSLG
jgi:hypothetical protein